MLVLVLQLIKLGYECVIEKGVGVVVGFFDDLYKEVGVEVIGIVVVLWKVCDIVVKVCQFEEVEFKCLIKGKMLILFFNLVVNEDGMELVKFKGVNVIVMEMVLWILCVQKMDVLFLMVNIVGYCVVIEVGNNFGCFFIGQIIVVGKVFLVKVLVVGVGVVGFVVIGILMLLGVIIYVFDVCFEVVE